jgi:hypothetical protein
VLSRPSADSFAVGRRQKHEGFPRPGGNFVAPGKNTRAFLDQGHGCRSRINYFKKRTGGKKERKKNTRASLDQVETLSHLVKIQELS